MVCNWKYAGDVSVEYRTLKTLTGPLHRHRRVQRNAKRFIYIVCKPHAVYTSINITLELHFQN